MIFSRLPRTRFLSPSVLLLMGLVVTHASWLVFRWGAERHALLLGNILYIAPTLVAALVMLSAARKQQGTARTSFLLVGCGFIMQCIGNSIWAFAELVTQTEPFPSWGDLFYLLFGPLVIAGLWQLMPAPRSRREALRLDLDVTITLGALGLYFWHFMLAPALSGGAAALPTVVTLAYPILDLLLLSLLLLLVLREPQGETHRPELLLMGFGLFAQISADVLFSVTVATGTYYSGHPLDALWTTSALLFALAAQVSLWPRQVHDNPGLTLNPTPVTATLPYVAVALAFGLLLATETHAAAARNLGSLGMLYGAVLVTALVVLRQLLAFHENHRLTVHLAQQQEELKAFSEQLELKVHARTAELEALSLRFRHDALHDTLTGLPNRTQFQKRLHEVVAQERPFTVFYLDFDRFKAVNDSFGHSVGDALLRGIAARLRDCIRPSDLVARLGGDEFAVLLDETSASQDAVWVAERITHTFQAPLQVAGHTLHTTASIGILNSCGNRSSAENVLRDADIAMYRAKALGKARYVIFEAAMRENIQTRLELETDLHGAIDRQELEVHYQPVVRVSDGTIAGFEALVRWRHPKHGLIAPADFIPLAEESGLIISLDRWVLSTACVQLKQWLAMNAGLAIGVNLSSRQFAQPDLALFVAGVLAKNSLEPHRLKLELTETLLLDGSDAVRETLTALRDLDVRLHIDDFGTGYSSLAYLQRFDADLLKVDRTFVARMLDNNEGSELVRTIITLAHNFGMKVVAEGVETVEQLERLRVLGCEYAQGYVFARPLPAAAIARFLQRRDGFRAPSDEEAPPSSESVSQQLN